MAMLLNLLQLALIAAIFFFDKFLDYLDWRGRAELLEQKHQKVWAFMHNRLARFLLSMAILAFLAKDFHDVFAVPPPSLVTIKAPPAPQIRMRIVAAPKEPNDSLRRRTMQVADEMQKYFAMRAENPGQPPFAAPNSNDANPSDEQKKAIERYRRYQQETWDYYFAHYKDRMIGIIKEYNAKGVRTGYLESGASQRPPVMMMPGSMGEGTYMDDLFQFRELAYHVDAEGNLIVITP